MFKQAVKCAVLSALVLVVSTAVHSAAPKGAKPKVAGVVQPFQLSQVRLLDGPYKDAMERDRKVLLDLDPDRLLHTFRLTAGLPTTAKPYGGWEEPGGELRGHVTGHYLTACALMYASTGDKAIKAKGDAVVAGLAKCQAVMPSKGYNKGFLSAYPESFFDRVDNSQPVWAPYYTLHKIMAGLLDMYTYTGNQQALDVVTKMSAWLKTRTDKLSEEKMQSSLNNEFGGMAEVFANLYAVTGNPDDLTMAKRFEKRWFLDPLAQGVDRLRGLHTNTHIPQVIGAAREYEMTGEKRYQDISTFFWTQVADHRSYATGGTSNYEHWRTDPDKMASEITVESQESCCTYNMLKLTEHLFTWKPEPHYADFYERALINGILDTQHPENGMTMYYVSMKPGHFKVFCSPENSFWCCTGTGWENHAKYGEAVYYHDDKGLWINQFIASELTWAQKGLTLRQVTKFPESEATSFTLTLKKPAQMPLHIRVPYWATKGIKVKVNGKAVAASAEPSSYFTLDRKWKTGDKVEVTLPMSLHLAPMSDDKNLVAIMYGPMVLAGELGTEKFTKDMQFSPDQRAQHGAPSIDVPFFIGAGDDVNTWVKPVAGKPLTFHTVGVGNPKDVTLIPIHKLFDQRYSIYWNRVSDEDYKKIQADAKEAAERTVDAVKPGVQESESAHNLQGDGTSAGEAFGQQWRHALDGGWFSWDLKVLPDKPQLLQCTFWGADGNRTFDILVDGKSLAHVVMAGNKGANFVKEDYPIPADMVKGKDKVTVKFQAASGSTAGGVFGVAILKLKQ